jgi:hypothetical protein
MRLSTERLITTPDERWLVIEPNITLPSHDGGETVPGHHSARENVTKRENSSRRLVRRLR